MTRKFKRSEVNQIIRDSEAFLASHGYTLPPFARFSPDEFKARKDELTAITGPGSVGISPISASVTSRATASSSSPCATARPRT